MLLFQRFDIQSHLKKNGKGKKSEVSKKYFENNYFSNNFFFLMLFFYSFSNYSFILFLNQVFYEVYVTKIDN